MTVGTSAIRNNDIGKAPDYRDNRSLMGVVSRYLAPGVDQSDSAWPDLFQKLVDAHKAFWTAKPDYQNAPRNRRQTSAELLSTHTLFTGSPDSFKPERVCLVASDTHDGWFAALLNQRVMEEAWGWRNVEKAQVEGLDESCFGLEEKLNRCFFERMKLSGGDEVVCNITGGYKGAIPEITLIAASHGWRLYYQHEESSGAALLRLPSIITPPMADGTLPKAEVSQVRKPYPQIRL